MNCAIQEVESSLASMYKSFLLGLECASRMPLRRWACVDWARDLKEKGG